MNTCHVYARKSTADDGGSVAQQETECRADAEAQGWTIAEVFADPDRSASRFVSYQRPGYDALVAAIESGAVRVLVLWESSRGSRTLTQWSRLLDECRRHRVLIRVTSHGRTYDVAGNHRDWLTLADEGVRAAGESDLLSVRTRRGKDAAAVKGQPMGPTPYGYARTYAMIRGKMRPDTQAPDPATAPLVVEAFRRVAEGDSLVSIARDFTAAGEPSPKGLPVWKAKATIRALVLNRRYLGEMIHNGQTAKVDAWPALIDAETFKRAERTLRNPARRAQRGTELRWVLSGIPRCGTCDARLITHYGGTSRTRRYCCSARRCTMIAAEPLDALVQRLVVVRLGRPDALDVFTRRTDDTAVAKARDELDRLRGELDDWRAAASRGEVTRASFATIEPGLLRSIDAADKRYNTLAMPPALAELAGVDIAAVWPGWPVRKRRDIIACVVDLVVGPAIRGHNWFEPTRLDGSRWVGDARTWGEL